VSEKSRLDFMCKSTLHDFNGTARKLSGSFEQNQNIAKGFVDVDIAGLTTDEPERDKNMYQMFDASLYPQIHFVFNDTDMTKILDHHDGEIKFTGIMTIHNISHPVTLISKGHMEENTLICEGQMLVHLKDYGLKAPSILGLIRVDDAVAVQYNIVFMNS
jgi:polyisoprenoid-binding protein YceI